MVGRMPIYVTSCGTHSYTLTTRVFLSTTSYCSGCPYSSGLQTDHYDRQLAASCGNWRCRFDRHIPDVRASRVKHARGLVGLNVDFDESRCVFTLALHE